MSKLVTHISAVKPYISPSEHFFRLIYIIVNTYLEVSVLFQGQPMCAKDIWNISVFELLQLCRVAFAWRLLSRVESEDFLSASKFIILACGMPVFHMFTFVIRLHIALHWGEAWIIGRPRFVDYSRKEGCNGVALSIFFYSRRYAQMRRRMMSHLISVFKLFQMIGRSISQSMSLSH